MSGRQAARAPYLPLIVAEWQRGTLEAIRVVLDDDLIDIRTFYAGDDGEPMRRGRTGIALSITHLPAPFDGVARAHREAVERGFIDAERAGR